MGSANDVRPVPAAAVARRWCRLGPLLGLAIGALLVALSCPPPAAAQGATGDRELIAILDLDRAGTTAAEASAVTDRLREEMLRSGAFKLVDRSQLESVLNEQALQQTGCTSQECAVQVGRILGIRKIVAGKVTKISDELWQLSTMMVDVETAETLRAETVIHEGNFVGLLRGGVTDMGVRLSGKAVAPRPPARTQQTVLEVVAAPDATVYLNGEFKSRGAAKFDDLVPGVYEVEVKSPRARPWKQSVLLSPGQTITINPVARLLRLAILPIRRTGTWKGSLEHTKGWVTRALVSAAGDAGFEVSHSAHVTGGPYPNAAGADLSARQDLNDDTWALFGGIDETFVRSQAQALEVDALLAFKIDASTPGEGSWEAYLVDPSGRVRSMKGTWPYSRGGPAVRDGVMPFLKEAQTGK